MPAIMPLTLPSAMPATPPTTMIAGGATTVSVSVDLDAPVDYHHFYRISGSPPSAPFLTEALAFLPDLFAELGVRATFFAIARDVEGEPRLGARLRRLVELGHEVANHSHRHPHAFRHLSREEKAREIDTARAVLEDATGAPVPGFRAPAYDLDPETLELLLERGYDYDSSLNPTPFLLPMKWIVGLKARRLRVGLGSWHHGLADRAPHFYQHRDGRLVSCRRPREDAEPALVELPLSVVPPLRFPFYGTITQILGPRGFRASLRLLRREGLPINYSLHAAEVTSLLSGSASPAGGPGRNGSTAWVPGYGASVEERRRLLRETLGTLTQGARSIPLAELAQEVRRGAAQCPPGAEEWD